MSYEGVKFGYDIQKINSGRILGEKKSWKFFYVIILQVSCFSCEHLNSCTIFHEL